MGNTVVWKPASPRCSRAYYLMRLLQEAGLPDGVINLVPGPGATIGDAALASPDLAGIHFTGSTAVFNGMWKTVGGNMGRYRNYPRIVGETGGKDFIVAHPSADLDALATAIVRGVVRVPGPEVLGRLARLRAVESLWPELRERLGAMQVATIRMGDVADFRNFMGAVIDGSVVRDAGRGDRGGEGERRHGDRRRRRLTTAQGYFVEPTVIETSDPGLPAAARRDLRAGRDGLRLRRDASGTRRSTLVDRRRRTR